MKNVLIFVLPQPRILALLLMVAGGIIPAVFPIAQAGWGTMPFWGRWVVLPTAGFIAGAGLWAWKTKHGDLAGRIGWGALAGVLATGGLEAVRLTSFFLGGMPGNLPELLGVLLTNRFMEGPSFFSDIVGWGYHVLNGAAFGVMYAVGFGRKPVLWGVLYALGIGIVFLSSPAVTALGIGFWGLEMPAFTITVGVAHFVFGMILGVLTKRWLSIL